MDIDKLFDNYFYSRLSYEKFGIAQKLTEKNRKKLIKAVAKAELEASLERIAELEADYASYIDCPHYNFNWELQDDRKTYKCVQCGKIASVGDPYNMEPAPPEER